MSDDIYRVVCDECGVVSFDVLDSDQFLGSTRATWYAGYHSGKDHPESDFQEAYPEIVGDNDE